MCDDEAERHLVSCLAIDEIFQILVSHTGCIISDVSNAILGNRCVYLKCVLYDRTQYLACKPNMRFARAPGIDCTRIVDAVFVSVFSMRFMFDHAVLLFRLNV